MPTAKQLANLRTGSGDGDIPKALPALTAEGAAEYVKLRAAGLPAVEAVQQFAGKGPHFSAKRIRAWADAWETAPLVVAAWEVWNGGRWQDLEPDRRLELALDHHLAQIAYYLYTSDINADDANIKKLAEAREAIRTALEGTKGVDRGAFAKWMLEVVGKAEAGPPVMTKGGVQVEQIGVGTES